MKRSLNNSKQQQPDNISKRRKTRQACVSCRKHKTRCESLDSDAETARCHRCIVLSVPCSFEESGSGSQADREDSTNPDVVSSPSIPFSPGTFTPEVLLVPIPPRVEGSDWIEAPMLAMQELLRRPSYSITAPIEMTITDVLLPEEINSLLILFETHYSPWLHLSLNDLCRDPFLDLAQCTTAARHLDPVRRSTVLPQLHKLVDAHMLKHAFSPVQCPEAVAAFLILALWSPSSGAPDTQVHDSRLIIASAVNIGFNICLNDAAAFLVGSSGEGTRHSEYLKRETALVKARLWFSVVNTEWTLCMGTGRMPTSRHAPLDCRVFDVTQSHSVPASRDMRLRFLSQMQNLTGQALSMRLSAHPRDIQAFRHNVVGQVLKKLQLLFMSIQPLTVAAEYEPFHLNMLVVHYYSCRLLILFHVLGEMRRHDIGNDDEVKNSGQKSWFATLNQHHQVFFLEWGVDAVVTSQALLVAFLSYPDTEGELLAAAPDSVFSMILFSSAFIIMANAAIMRHTKDNILDTSDGLLEKVVERVKGAARVSKSAEKCEEVIRKLLQIWRREAELRSSNSRSSLTSLGAEGSSARNHNHSHSQSHAPQQTWHAQASTSAMGMAGCGEEPTLDSVFVQDVNPVVNPDMFLDADFWNSFAHSSMRDPHMFG